jgi:hypothetical protein
MVIMRKREPMHGDEAKHKTTYSHMHMLVLQQPLPRTWSRPFLSTKPADKPLNQPLERRWKPTVFLLTCMHSHRRCAGEACPMEKKGTCTHASIGWLAGLACFLELQLAGRSASGRRRRGGPASVSRAQLAAPAMRESAPDRRWNE